MALCPSISGRGTPSISDKLMKIELSKTEETAVRPVPVIIATYG